MPSTSSHKDVADTLKEWPLQGQNNWKDLYTSEADEPISDAFKVELIKTGYLIQAAYKYLDIYDEPQWKGNLGPPVVYP